MNRTEFCEFITTVGLLSADELTTFEKSNPQIAGTDVQTLAKLLVQQEKLTKYQAAAIYQGKGKSLIYGEYVVLDRIGAGGMGQVFKARHRRMDRIVALKVMSQAAVKSAEAVKRFEREVRATAKLMHPNIVSAYDAGVQEGALYLVMEYVEGGDFSSLIKQQVKFGIKQACGFFEQAARGFAAAHAKGIVHRDVKPGNILVDKTGIVKVLDMGLARIDDDGVGGTMTEGELTQSGSVMGTVDYMAPEQALNTRHADAKSDVYGLGCTFYRVLTGEPVFGGQTLVEKILAHRDHPVPSIRRLRPDAPPAFDVLLSRMLAKNPVERPTMQEVADTLATLDSAAPNGGGYGVAQEPAAAPLHFPPGFATSHPTSNTFGPGTMSAVHKVPAAASKKKNNNLPVLIGAGAVGLAVVGGALWAMLRGNDEPVVAAVVPDDAIGVEAPLTPPPIPTASPSATPTPPSIGPTNRPPVAGIVSVNGGNTNNNSTSNSTNSSTNSSTTGTNSTTGSTTSTSGSLPSETRYVDPAVERRVALKVLELGGNCFVQGPGVTGKRVVRPDELPPGPFLITSIDLGHTNTNDKDIESLVGLGNLNNLGLALTSISDACLPTVAKFPHLYSLILNSAGRKVTDAGIQSLESLKSLTYLSATNTSVSGVGARTLQGKLPSIRVTWDGGMIEGKPYARGPVNISFRSTPIDVAGRSSIDQAIISAGSTPDATASPTTGSVATNSTTGSTIGMSNTGSSNTSTSNTGTTTNTTGTSTSTDTTAAAADATPKKLAVPSATEQQTALKSVKEIFADDYAGAKSFDQKGALAAKLLDQAKQTFDDPMSRYILLTEARNLATEASAIDTVFDALTPLVEDYDVEEAGTLIDAWSALLKRPRLDSAAIQRIFKESTTRFDIAVTDAKFEDAKKYGEFALTTARRVPNPNAAVKSVTERNLAMAAREKEWPTISALATKLQKEPDDAEANLAVARYQALVADDWKGAFPMYVKGSDALLAELGKKSVAELNTASAQASVGDAWWDAAQEAKPPLKNELLAGAKYWYELAAPALTGLPKTRVEKRRTDLKTTELAQKIPATTLPGFVAAVALASNDTNTGVIPNRNFGGPSSTSSSTGPRPMNANGNVDERQIAQTILGFGGTVNLRIATQNGTTSFRVPPRGVLPLENFTITSVYYENLNSTNDIVDGNDIAILSNLPNLRYLNIFSSRVDERAFAAIRGCQNLESISIMTSSTFNDVCLSHLKGLSNLRSLNISYAPITDAGIVHLKDLTGLTNMSLGNTQITGATFGQLINLTQLRSLYFFYSPINDAGLTQIQRLNWVSRLDLSYSAVTDAGIANLRNMTALEYLSLRGTGTTDACFRPFEKSRLTHIVVSNRVTTAAAQAFQKALPGCRIEFPQP